VIPTEYLLIVFGVAIVYIIYYIFSKDSQLTSNIRAVASAVEDANRQIYMVEKKLFEIEKKLEEKSPRSMSDEEVYQEIERTAYDLLNPVVSQLKALEQNLSDLATAADSRLTNLEGGIKQMSMPQAVHGNDDSKITSLFTNGSDVDAIAKELHLSKAEVEFVLKINKLR
jgi:hypothetical protein